MESLISLELLPTQDPLSFFEDIYRVSQQAIAGSEGQINYFYQIGDSKICLSFAGKGLVSAIAPALAHLVIPAVNNPDLTIVLWDSKTTQTPMPPPVWQREHLQKRGEISNLSNDRICTCFQCGSNALSVLDLERNLGIYWVNKPEELPYWETGSPLKNIFQQWFSQQNQQIIHAGAVGLSTGGVLMVGKGGMGKSTTALACLKSDLFYLSDDYTLVSVDSLPHAYSLYSSAKKKPDDIERLPWLKPLIHNSNHLDQEKALYFLAEHFSERIINDFPLKAILIPRVTGQINSNLEPTSASAALTALVPSTIKQLPGSGKEACDRMTQLTQKLPSYYLNLGTDLAQIPQIILNLLR
jgi:hypothetical protein